MNKMVIGCGVILILWGGTAIADGNFDGSRSLLCKTGQGVQYHRDGDPQAFHPESAGLPQSFVVDFEKRMVRPTRDSVIQRRTKIKRMERVEEKIVLQGAEDGVEGVDDGVGWTMALKRLNGKFVITASGSDMGYIVFGSCSASVP